MTNSIDPDEVAHDEPSNWDQHCFRIQLFESMSLIVTPQIRASLQILPFFGVEEISYKPQIPKLSSVRENTVLTAIFLMLIKIHRMSCDSILK